ncbi:MAG: hypothetical protein K2M92_02190, partial [Bacteroidales bacterium]|nr:hypothetical protein [Bacteroidales bacterium]
MKKAKLLWWLSGYFLIAALFFGFGNSLRAQGTYTLVTDASTLATGDEVLIVGKGGYAMTASSSGTNAKVKREAIQVTITDNNTITDPVIATEAGQKQACVFTLEKDASGNYAFNDKLNEA